MSPLIGWLTLPVLSLLVSTFRGSVFVRFDGFVASILSVQVVSRLEMSLPPDDWIGSS